MLDRFRNHNFRGFVRITREEKIKKTDYGGLDMSIVDRLMRYLGGVICLKVDGSTKWKIAQK